MKKVSVKYEPSVVEPYWQEVWQKEGTFRPDLDKAKNPFYNLMMFPYPSAEGLHAGNMYAFTGADIYGRFMRMQGYDVFEPIGLDGFGIHSENYALKVGKNPMDQAKVSEANFYRQLHEIGNGYDWSRTVETYDPKYYKWTQWIFIQMYKKGLAVRKKSPVNFCPSCKTVLADEQVITKVKNQKSKIKNDKEEINGEKVGVCERCETIVEKKNLEQWFFKITDYAERLLGNIPKLNWSEKVKIAQTNWIGKSEGMLIRFPVADSSSQGSVRSVFPASVRSSLSSSNELRAVGSPYTSAIPKSKFRIEVYTVFPETIYGVTYMVLAPENPLVFKLTTAGCKNEVQKYVEQAAGKNDIERLAEGKTKTGVFTGAYCLNPVNGDRVPIWVADYVLSGYGTGAVMGVPGSDHRDFSFAKKYNLPIIRVIGASKKDTSEVKTEEDVLEEGFLVNSGEFSSLETPNPAKEKIKDFLEEKGWGQRQAHYHLRDWLISRQRYWGPPIPMIYCKKCDWQPVPEEDLPVKLPYIENYKPIGTGKSPLATHPEFYNVKCPNCGGEAVRETDVSDTFLDSAWYFLCYLATDWDDMPFPSVNFAEDKKQKTENKEEIKNWKLKIENSAQRAAWLPVHMYIGGAEHSVLHLLYSRFIAMFLYDLGLISFEEPFSRFFAHGLLIKEGAKMSKSKENVVVPDAYIKKFGADTMRCYLMFLGQFSQGGDFHDTGVEGMNRFLRRVWKFFKCVQTTEKEEDKEILKMINKAVMGVTGDIERLSYNTVIAKLMEFYNFISDKKSVGRDVLIDYIKLFAPFAPHLAEELYQSMVPTAKEFVSIHSGGWPEFKQKLLEEETLKIVVQENVKLRDIIEISKDEIDNEELVIKKAEHSPKVQKALEGKSIKRKVYIKGKVVNFVTD